MTKARHLLLIGAALSCLFATQAAVAGSVTIKNCVNRQIWAKAFNSNDGFMLIAASEGCVQPSQSIGLSCATGSCKIATKESTCDTFQTTVQGTFSGALIYTSKNMARGTLLSGNTCP
jgi:hypothetical protein